MIGPLPPATGTAYAAMKAKADGAWPAPNLQDHNVKHGVYVLAAAFVYAATRSGKYRDKANTGIAAALRTFPKGSAPKNSGLGPYRQIPAYVIAASLTGLDISGWLRWASTAKLGTHPRWGGGMRACHDDSNNNWGAWAGFARVTTDVYLGDADLADAVATMRGFLGDRNAWSGFMGTSPTIATWATGAAPVNAPGTRNGIDLNGMVPADISRDGDGTVPLRWPPTTSGKEYQNETLAGLADTALVLRANGYPDVFEWSDKAIKRMADCCVRGGFMNLSSVGYHVPWILNQAYGAGYPTKAGGLGRALGWTDWLCR